MTRQTSLTAWPNGVRLAIRAADRLLYRWRSHRGARRTIGTLHGPSDSQLKDAGVKRDAVETRFSW